MKIKNKGIKAALIYMLLGGLWIFFSDRALVFFHINIESELFQTLKGFGFIVFTGLLLYALIDKNEKLSKITLDNLKLNKDEIKLLMDNTEEVFILLDKELRLVSFNKQFEDKYKKMLHKNVQKGVHILDYTQTERKEIVAEIYRRVLQGEMLEDEIQISIPSHGAFVYLNHYKPAYDDSGNIIGAFVTVRDVTEKKKIEHQLVASERRFRSLVEHAGDIISLVNADGIVTYVSPSFERITGFSSEETVGKPNALVIHPDFVAETTRIFNQLLLRPGATIPRLTRFRHKDGHYIWVEGVATNLLNDKNVGAIVSNYRDITERKEAELKLQETEAHFRALIEHNYDGIVLRDENFVITYSSSSAERILGWTENDKVGKDFFVMTHPDDLEKVEQNYADVINNPGVAFPLTFRTKHKNGHYVWVERILTNMLHDNVVKAIVANFRDVSLQRDLQEQLIKNEKRFRALVENSGDAIAILGMDGKPTYASPSVKKVLGYTDEEAMKLDLVSLSHPDDIAEGMKAFELSFANPGVSIVGKTGRMLHKDGTWHWYDAILTNMLHDPDIAGIVNNFRDITERKEAEDKLKNSEERLRTIFNNEPECVKVLDISGNLVEINPAGLKMLAIKNQDQIKGENVIKMVHPEDRVSFDKLHKSIIKGESSILHFRIINFDNVEMWMETHGAPLYDSTNKVYAALYVTRDVTEAKKAERQKEFDGNNLAALINNTNDLMWSISTDGKLITSNRAFEELIFLVSGIVLLKGVPVPTKGFSEDQLARWDGFYKRAFSGESFTIIEYSDYPEVTWTEISFYPILNGKEIVGTACYSRNITERKKFEKQLEENSNELLAIKNELEHNEARLKQAQEIAQVGNWEINFETNVSHWSDETCRIYGISSEKKLLSFEDWLSFIHPDDLENIKMEIEVANMSFNDISFYTRIVRPNGEVRHIYQEAKYEFDSHGKPKGMFGIVHDITEEKEAEEKLKQSHQLLQKLTDKVPIAVYKFEMDKNGNMTFPFMSKGVEDILPGINIEDLKKDAVFAFNTVYSDDLEKVFHSILLSKEQLGDWEMEFRIRRNDNQVAWLKGSSRPERKDNGSTVWFGYLEDITEKRLIHENIRVAKERYDIVAKATNEAIWDWDLSGNYLHWGEGFKTLFGYDLEMESFSSDSWSRHIYSEDKERIVDSINNVIHSKTISKWKEEYRYVKADGNIANVLDHGFVIRNEQGEPERMIGAMQDVTERKYAEEEIRTAKERYDIVAKATNDALYDWDLKTGEVFRMGEGLKVLFGYDVEEAATEVNFWRNRIHPSEVEEVWNKFYAILKDPLINVCNQEYRFRKADGTYAYVYDKGFVIRDDEGEPIRMIGATQDISKIRESELLLKTLNENLEKRAEELAVSNKELEQFAYVASHDLQEPLRMVTSFLTQLEKKYKNQLDAKAHQYIYFASDGAIRMRKIILDLLEYSRAGRAELDYEEVDMNSLLFEAVQLNRIRIDEKNALIEWKNLPTVRGNKSGLQQVLQNLISNALKYQKVDHQPIIQVKATEMESHWMFCISDNGIGIDPQFFDKIFVIFKRLHNKEEFSGTGIGLAICKKIVEMHGGKIWVDSVYGNGSKFYFTIKKQQRIN